jgi:hypothetical protein
MSSGQDFLGQDEIDELMRGLDGTPPPAAAEQ